MIRSILTWLGILQPVPPDPLVDLCESELEDLLLHDSLISSIPPGQCWATWDVAPPFGAHKQAVVQILSQHCRRTRLRYILAQRDRQRNQGCKLSWVLVSVKVPLGYEEAVQ